MELCSAEKNPFDFFQAGQGSKQPNQLFVNSVRYAQSHDLCANSVTSTRTCHVCTCRWTVYSSRAPRSHLMLKQHVVTWGVNRRSAQACMGGNGLGLGACAQCLPKTKIDLVVAPRFHKQTFIEADEIGRTYMDTFH